MKTSTLHLNWRRREARNGVEARDYLDFVVDGESLEALLQPGDNVGCLGWGAEAAEREAIEVLLGKRAPPSGRVPIFVCVACGGLDCGAVTVRIERTAEGVSWSDFAFEHPADYEEPIFIPWDPPVGPFLFDRTQYGETLRARLDEISR